MDNLEKRPVQTKVKHEILEEYLTQWGYIITAGLKGAYYNAEKVGKTLTSRFIYVDCFSFMGKYSTEKSQPVYGSPIIGIRSMDQLSEHFKNQNRVSPYTNAILIEEKRENYEMLLNTLQECGFQDRVKHTTDFFALQPGEIAVINDDYMKHLDKLLAFTSQEYTWSFYLLDDYGPSGIPLSAVSKIVSQPRTDAIINLMYQDLHRKTGSAIKDQPYLGHMLHLGYYDAVYGTDTWRKIAQLNQGYEMESKLVNLYKDVLEATDNDLAVKRILLKFPDKERTMFYLFLTTHDGTGALKMNEILDSAKISEYDYREKIKSEKTSQMSMFGDDLPDPSRPQQAEYDIDKIAELIYESCKGKTTSLRKILAILADTPYYFDQVKKAMTKLKRESKCTYKELNNKELIAFK